mmetsp:Transcript_8273/g.13463  ORF Transcript_8273/g.13463 Transcript_8273/m.13463 type:complete len:214 (-) Transcript_8273:529-1170(-)|eukprot:CAMPEP_0184645722 /NCGR_PEP_ID=MMETSP0308-20130426/2284_1 /TAXON_ID=38269 /ORGANISM="Gloeochaete witrockiana, Strain SAG 46.84" /LENGTH=213 /DNA_ID=CAMNT_0027075039 /DNA_START=172 /DNA_END=813 /DNA_ORIENTATION=+
MAISPAQYDLLFKLLIIGDSGVGKSAILLRFVDDAFPSTFATIGVDFRITEVSIDSKSVQLQVWDTAGHERFRTITTCYYRGAHAIILTFDVSNRESFLNIPSWLRDVERFAKKDALLLLVGNKSDLCASRTVPYDEAKDFADSLGIAYIETSAKDSTNVRSAFTSLAAQLVERSFFSPPTAPSVNDKGAVTLGPSSSTVLSSIPQLRCCTLM